MQVAGQYLERTEKIRLLPRGGFGTQVEGQYLEKIRLRGFGTRRSKVNIWTEQRRLGSYQERRTVLYVAVLCRSLLPPRWRPNYSPRDGVSALDIAAFVDHGIAKAVCRR